MGTHRPRGRSTFVAVLLLGAGILFLPSLRGSEAAHAAGDPLVATSVCEAQQLKARKAENPDLEIEIPAEFNKPFPTLAACDSHDARLGRGRRGPAAADPFSHKHHAGDFGIDCQYCHSGTDRSRAAGVPSVELCMGCHAQFPAEYDELEGIRILKEHWRTGSRSSGCRSTGCPST